MLKKLKESYQTFKEKATDAFDYFIYELTHKDGYKGYLENKASLARLIQREIDLEYSITSRDVKLVSVSPETSGKFRQLYKNHPGQKGLENIK